MMPCVLILTPYANVREFQQRVFSRALLWGLEHQCLDFELHQPWKARNDLHRFAAVLTWSFGWAARRELISYCRNFEKQCVNAGLVVVNPITDIRMEHSHYLNLWAQHGLPCARSQRFGSLDEIEIPFPLILRRDGVHAGKKMFLVHSLSEARLLVDQLREQTDGAKPLDLNLAVEFIDTRNSSGENHKLRSFVVGDQVFPVHEFRSRGPFVGYKDIMLGPVSCAADRAFLTRRGDADEILLRAARALKAEIISIDHARRADGSHVLWEPNFGPLTHGDSAMPSLSIRQQDLFLGRTMAMLIESRMSHRFRDMIVGHQSVEAAFDSNPNNGLRMTKQELAEHD